MQNKIFLLNKCDKIELFQSQKSQKEENFCPKKLFNIYHKFWFSFSKILETNKSYRQVWRLISNCITSISFTNMFLILFNYRFNPTIVRHNLLGTNRPKFFRKLFKTVIFSKISRKFRTFWFFSKSLVNYTQLLYIITSADDAHFWFTVLPSCCSSQQTLLNFKSFFSILLEYHYIWFFLKEIFTQFS